MIATAAKQRYKRAKELFRQGWPEEALEYLDPLAEQFPDQKNIHLARAECLIKLERFEEARPLCERVVSLHDDARARRLLQSIPDSHSSAPLANHVDPDARGRILRRLFVPRMWSLSLVLVLGLVVIAFTFVLARDMSTMPQSSPPLTQQEKQEIELRFARVPEPPVAVEPTSYVGRQIPQDVWMATLDEDGVPEWQPGIYRKVVCPGHIFVDKSGRNHPRTLDIYIPEAYALRELEFLPAVYISMPRTNPGFIDLESWAERRGVILVAINTNRNGPALNNAQAQDAAFELLAGNIRIHSTLNFTIGMSGGAQSSWMAASRYPDIIAGVVMMGQYGSYDPLPRHMRVAYIHGQTDHNREWILGAIRRLRANGNEVRHQIVPGGHVMGPVQVRTDMLDWMLDAARQDLEGETI